jgi:hypothetical protein
MKYTFYLVAVLSLLFVSCEQKTKNNKQKIDDVDFDTTSRELPESHELMYEIENNLSNLNEVRSLRWEKTIYDNSEFREVHAYMNDEGVPSKIVEYFSMGNFQEQGERHYYFKGSEILAVIKKADVWADSNTAVYKETETYYKNGKSIQSRLRASDYIDEINEANWKQIRPISHSKEVKTVEDILKGKGAFRTHFISVIKGQEQLFLLLGEPKDGNRYVTTVLADHRVPFVNNLLHNLDAYKFRPIDIKFQIVGGNGQPEFRMLTIAQWAD